MSPAQYTADGLPKVAYVSVIAFARDMDERGDQTVEWLRMVEEENSAIMSYISVMQESYPIELRRTIVRHMLGLYVLLRNQARNNNLDRRYEQ